MRPTSDREADSCDWISCFIASSLLFIFLQENSSPSFDVLIRPADLAVYGKDRGPGWPGRYIKPMPIFLTGLRNERVETFMPTGGLHRSMQISLIS